MPKFSGINRPYAAGEIEKTPQEKQRELDEKMKKFLAKGGKVEKDGVNLKGKRFIARGCGAVMSNRRKKTLYT